VKSSLDNAKLNDISKGIQEAAKAAGVSNYVMGIVGIQLEKGKLSR
jgi:hypothetical protein